jgi:hypothetical protein
MRVYNVYYLVGPNSSGDSILRRKLAQEFHSPAEVGTRFPFSGGSWHKDSILRRKLAQGFHSPAEVGTRMEEITKILNGGCLYTVTTPYKEFRRPDRMAPNSTVRGGEHFVPELQFPELHFDKLLLQCKVSSCKQQCLASITPP